MKRDLLDFPIFDEQNSSLCNHSPNSCPTESSLVLSQLSTPVPLSHPLVLAFTLTAASPQTVSNQGHKTIYDLQL